MLKKIFYKLNKMIYIVKYIRNIKFGKNVNFRNGFRANVSKNAKILIGSGCFFNNDCSLNAKDNITIGNDCIFGENVKIYDHNHKFNIKNKLIKNQGYTVKSVTIGNNCWIGSNACILKGVSIGNNVVIGAGCIIDSDVKDNQLVKRNESIITNEIIFKEEQ